MDADGERRRRRSKEALSGSNEAEEILMNEDRVDIKPEISLNAPELQHFPHPTYISQKTKPETEEERKADVAHEEVEDSSFLRTPKFDRRQRRKSPVTVQEWVASLPPPHVLQRQALRAGKKEESSPSPSLSSRGRKQREASSTEEEEEEAKKRRTKAERSGSLGSLAGSTGSTGSTGSKGGMGSIGRLAMLNSMLQTHESSEGGLQPREARMFMEALLEDDDGLTLGDEADSSPKSLNIRNSSGEDRFRGTTSLKSIMSLANSGNNNDEENVENLKSNLDLEGDSSHRGDSTSSMASSSGNPLRGISLEARRRLFLRSHEHASFQSDISAKTASSVDSVLFSREVDPAELLMDLGFGGQSSDLLTRIPARFFQPSQAKGINVEDFLRRQEEIMERFDSGFNGYRGLNGSSGSGRPSELVEKIIDKIRSQERQFRRQMSLLSQWTSCDSLQLPNSLATAGPNPNGSFASVVGHAQRSQLALRRSSGQLMLGLAGGMGLPGLSGAEAFKAAAHSVLSPANRRFLEAQNENKNKTEEVRKLIIAGETFKVNEDLNVIDEEEEEEEVEAQSEERLLRRLSSLSSKKQLPKRDSSLSMASSCSVDSDWSDEEMEELERILDDLQERSEAAEMAELADGQSGQQGQHRAAQERWSRLKRSRVVAMQRLRMVKRMSCSSLEEEEEEEEENKQHIKKDAGDLSSSLANERLTLTETTSLPSESRPHTPCSPSSMSVSSPFALQHQMSYFDPRQLMLAHQGDQRIPRRFSAQRMRM